MKSKKTLIPLLITLVLGFGLLGYGWYSDNRHPDMVRSDYFNGEYGYHCSPAVKMRWTKYSYSLPGDEKIGVHKSAGYFPIDKAEAQKVCTITSAV
jgi:hypothetical protein